MVRRGFRKYTRSAIWEMHQEWDLENTPEVDLKKYTKSGIWKVHYSFLQIELRTSSIWNKLSMGFNCKSRSSKPEAEKELKTRNKITKRIVLAVHFCTNSF
jgi:hypothetical protein